MFASIRTAFLPAAQHKRDPINEMVSSAKQDHERAVGRLSKVLCEKLEGPNCSCLTLEPKQ